MVVKQPLGGRAVLLDLVQRFQDSYPPEGQQFFKDYGSTYGKKPETYAIYGSEAMPLILDAMKRAGTRPTTAQPSTTRSTRPRTSLRRWAPARSIRTATRR